MPITLVTGLPRHGKTQYTLFRWRAEAAKESPPRQVYHNNIPGLNIPGWKIWDVNKWQDLPAGALLIVDEAQEPFPVRGRGEPPEHIGALATHGHIGIDIVLITQDPMLIDAFVRRLVDRHFHVVRKFGTYWVTIHEFVNGCRDSVAKSRKGSVQHPWRYSKEVWSWYKSSDLHTVKVRLPAKLMLIPLGIALLLGGGWMAWQSVPHGESRDSGGGSSSQGQASSQYGQGLPAARKAVLSPQQYAESYTPRIEGLPHTAPVYDDATKPVDAPYPAACISMPAKKRCSCYSQQATKLEMPKDLCEQIAAGGFFVAWKQQVVQAVPVAQPAPDSGPSPAIGIGSGSTAVTMASAAPAVPPDLGAPPRVRR